MAVWVSGPSRTVNLDDGTRLRLLGVTIGTNQFNTERAWHPLARRVLPARLQKYIPPPQAGSCGFHNGATYWFELRDKTNGLVRPSWTRAEMVSRDGEMMPVSHSPMCSLWQGPFAISFDCFPRRFSVVRYRIYGEGDKLLGEMRLPNPIRGPFPDWKPDAFPTTRTNGDLTTTLRSVRKFMEATYYRGTNASGTNIHYRTDVEFRWRGLPTTNWEVGPCFVDDATGNSIGWLHPGLPQGEKIWRWRVWMQRRKDAPFAPEERFVITNLPIPSAGSWTVLNITTNIHGLDFWIGCWAGPSALTLSNGYPFQIAPPPNAEDWREWGWNSKSGAFIKTNIIKRPTLIAAVRENGIEIRAEVAFRDQNGRLLPRDYDPKTPTSTSYPMQLKPGVPSVEGHFYRPILDDRVESITLEVIVYPRPEMHFFIAPPVDGEWIGRRPNPPAG